MNNDLSSVDAIDEMLDKQFNITDEVDTEQEETEVDTNLDENLDEVTETPAEENEQKDEQESDDIKSPEEETDEKPKETVEVKEKPTSSQKRDYSFEQMRKENKELKQKLEGNETNKELLERMANQHGYKDVESFTKAYEEARIAKEAKDKGYDPVLYAKLQESNKRIAQLEQTTKEAELKSKANNFRSAIDNAISTYNLGENGKDEIFNRLEEAGFTVDTLLGLPNPEIVIKGILSDKIADISKQSQIDKIEKLDSLAEEKHTGVSSNKSVSLDDLISQEMKSYKANNFYD